MLHAFFLVAGLTGAGGMVLLVLLVTVARELSRYND